MNARTIVFSVRKLKIKIDSKYSKTDLNILKMILKYFKNDFEMFKKMDFEFFF